MSMTVLTFWVFMSRDVSQKDAGWYIFGRIRIADADLPFRPAIRLLDLHGRNPGLTGDQKPDLLDIVAGLQPEYHHPTASQQFLNGCLRHQFPAVEDANRVTDPLYVFQNVRGIKNGGVLAQPLHHLQDIVPSHRIEAGGGFVQDEQVGVINQGLSNF